MLFGPSRPRPASLQRGNAKSSCQSCEKNLGNNPSPHPHPSQREWSTVGSSSIGARLESSLLCSFSILFLNRSSNSCGKKSRLAFLRAVLRLRFCFFFLGVITNCGILGWWRRQVNAKGYSEKFRPASQFVRISLAVLLAEVLLYPAAMADFVPLPKVSLV